MTPFKWFAAGAVLGILLLGIWGRREFAGLRSYADSLRVVSARADSESQHFGDSLEAVVAGLKARKNVFVTRAMTDTAHADSLLRLAHTATDSLAAYKVTVETLRLATRSLFEALEVSDSIARAETLRADSCERTREALNTNIANLTRRVDRLQGLPKWARISLDLVALGGATYAGYKVGQHHGP